jgi:hypothetical protein
MSHVSFFMRLLAGLALAAALSACTADHKWAEDAAVAQARYVDPSPPSITLFTSINSRNNSGAHSGLLINADERVLYDPAGEFANSVNPTPVERADMLYGITPGVLAGYVSFQGTAPFKLTMQTVYVTPEVAALVKERAIALGSANKATCAVSIASILRGVPGFESLPQTYFPKTLSRGFAQLPGVQTKVATSLDGPNRGALPGAPALVGPGL